MNVRIPKGPHRPAASAAARLHPDNILKAVLDEAMEGGVETEAHIAAMAAKASPIEIKEAPKRRRAMPPLNPDLLASAAVGSAALAAQKGEGE